MIKEVDDDNDNEKEKEEQDNDVIENKLEVN